MMFFSISFMANICEISKMNSSKRPSTEWDYTFIDYFQKAYENENNNSELKRNIFMTLRKAEARRDYYNGMIKEIKQLEQLDHTPNLELTEPKCEIYKITINGSFVCGKGTVGVDKKNTNPNCGNIYCNHRVLFQNEDGNINMGAWFTDPVNDVYDIHWFQVLELEMETSVLNDEGLILDEDVDNIWTRSCFVELHRNGVSRGVSTNANHYVYLRDTNFLVFCLIKSRWTLKILFKITCIIGIY